MQFKDIYQKWMESATLDPEILLELESIAGDDGAIGERFFCDLQFGTGGLRGIIGAGTNRMNVYTVARATLGLSGYLKEKFENPCVAIAYDSRKNSNVFAKAAAEVLAGSGIFVYIFDEIMPTPVLSFAVRHLAASAGIVITASHNPAEYNGYKVYGADGCQITPEAAGQITAHIARTDALDGLALGNYEQYRDKGLIRSVPDDTLDAYYGEVLRRGAPAGKESDLRVVYTPLNGTGNKPVRHILNQIGVADVILVPEQEAPDHTFSTCPYPNPEEEEALSLAIRLAKKRGADIVLATDPDCDRVGAAVRHGGSYVLINGNQMGVLLFDFVCAMRQKAANMPESPVAVKTIVTTEMARGVADEYGVALWDVLTGFKYIGERIGLLEQNGEADRFVFGFEESYGYLAGSYVRDKDAVEASMLICQMAARYKERGMSLVDALDSLYKRHGYYFEMLESYSFEGMDGSVRMKDVMAVLRSDPPRILGGLTVERFRDYLGMQRDEEDEKVVSLPRADVVSIQLNGGSKVTVRPSGTEPKLKVYYSLNGGNKDESETLYRRISGALKALLQI